MIDGIPVTGPSTYFLTKRTLLSVSHYQRISPPCLRQPFASRLSLRQEMLGSGGPNGLGSAGGAMAELVFSAGAVDAPHDGSTMIYTWVIQGSANLS